MRITSVSSNNYRYRNTNNFGVTFTQSKKKNELNTDKLLKLWATGALTSLAIAYGGGKMIIADYEKNVNEILDRYEKELKQNQQVTDSIISDLQNIDFSQKN